MVVHPMIFVFSLSLAVTTAAKSDDEIAKDMVKAGNEFYDYCLEQAATINQALEQNKSVENVPNRTLTARDVTFMLMTRKNPTVEQNLTATNFSALQASNYDPKKLTAIYIPGVADPASIVAKRLSVILKSVSLNLIVMNWDSYSFFNPYYVVNRTLFPLSEVCAQFIRLTFRANSTSEQTFLMGGSAGGQTVGLCGKKIPNIARILAIDPAGPCFTYQDITKKLAKNDAVSVHGLHCSAGILGTPYFYEELGADFFYGFGGIFQPQCRNENSTFNIGVCSHTACGTYFFESLVNFNISIGTRCTRYEDIRNRTCSFFERKVSGFFSDSKTTGIYAVDIDYPLRPSDATHVSGWNN